MALRVPAHCRFPCQPLLPALAALGHCGLVSVEFIVAIDVEWDVLDVLGQLLQSGFVGVRASSIMGHPVGGAWAVCIPGSLLSLSTVSTDKFDVVLVAEFADVLYASSAVRVFLVLLRVVGLLYEAFCFTCAVWAVVFCVYHMVRLFTYVHDCALTCHVGLCAVAFLDYVL